MGTWPSLQVRSRLFVLYAGRWKADRLPRRHVIADLSREKPSQPVDGFAVWFAGFFGDHGGHSL